MELDVRGEICPYPMLKTVEFLKQHPGIAALTVLTDHSPALATIPWEAAKLGYEAEIETVGPAEWRIRLRKAAGPVDPRAVMSRLAHTLAQAGEGGV